MDARLMANGAPGERYWSFPRFGRPGLPDIRSRANQHSRAALDAEPARISTIWRPYINPRAADQPTGIVDEKPPEVFPTGVQLDVARQRKKSWIGGDDARAHVASAPRRSLQTIHRDPDRHRFAVAHGVRRKLPPRPRSAPHDYSRGAIRTHHDYRWVGDWPAIA